MLIGLFLKLSLMLWLVIGSLWHVVVRVFMKVCKGFNCCVIGGPVSLILIGFLVGLLMFLDGFWFIIRELVLMGSFGFISCFIEICQPRNPNHHLWTLVEVLAARDPHIPQTNHHWINCLCRCVVLIVGQTERQCQQFDRW